MEAERNFRRIFATLSSELRSLRLRKTISVRRIASDLITDDAAANRYCDNFSVEQVVWGRALAGKSNSRQINKFEVSLTWRVPARSNVEAIRTDVQILAAGRRWRIRDEEELDDVAIVAEDFVEVGLGAIGIGLYVEGRLNDAVAVFERVVSGLQKHAGSAPSGERTTQIARFLRILNGARNDLAIEAHEKGEHAAAAALLDQVLASSPPSADVLMTMARAHYYLGDLDKAIEYTDRIRTLDKDHPVVPLNLAFFNILRGKYEEVGRCYDRLLKTRRDKAPLLPSTSQFLEERYAERPEEHAFLYGMSIINGLADPEVMRQDLRLFMDRTETEQKYAPLRSRAAKLLDEMPEQ